jgi:hypothetical protein
VESCRAGVEFEIWVSGFLVGQHEEVQVLSHVVQVSISDADGLNMSKPTICNRDKFGVEWSYIYINTYIHIHIPLLTIRILLARSHICLIVKLWLHVSLAISELSVTFPM